MDVFNEFSHSNIFLHMDELEIFNFNHKNKDCGTLSSVHGINLGKY